MPKCKETYACPCCDYLIACRNVACKRSLFTGIHQVLILSQSISTEKSSMSILTLEYEYWLTSMSTSTFQNKYENLNKVLEYWVLNKYYNTVFWSYCNMKKYSIHNKRATWEFGHVQSSHNLKILNFRTLLRPKSMATFKDTMTLMNYIEKKGLSCCHAFIHLNR